MHSRFEQHLEELDRGLKGLPQYERREMCEEAAQHLSELAAAYEELGATEEEAVRAALASFGEAQIVAMGIRHEAIRKRKRQRTERAAAISAAILAGGVLGVGLGSLPFAPLLIAGHEIGAIYPILGALAGFACLTRRRTLASFTLSTLAILTVIAPLAIALHQVFVYALIYRFGPHHPGETVPFALLNWLMFSGFLWTGIRETAILWPGLLVGIPVFMLRRVQSRWVFAAAITSYAIASLFYAMDRIAGRSYITHDAATQAMICYAFIGIKQGFFFALLLFPARHWGRILAQKCADFFKDENSASSPAGRPHTA